jgi:hypothetical protein
MSGLRLDEGVGNMGRTTMSVERGGASSRLGAWALSLVSLLAGCAADAPRSNGTTDHDALELDASARLDVPAAGAEVAVPSTCVDEDGDGFGPGGCASGPDCDDHDRAVTDACYRCALPATDCPCDDGAAPIACDLTTDASRGAGGTCHPGQRSCVAGRWGRCEPYRSGQQYVGAISACAGSCLAGCRRQVVCPEAGDPFTAECENVAIGSLAPAVFCPTTTTPGGVTAGCAASNAGYTRSEVSFPWIDACSAPGHSTYLQGVNDGIATDVIPFPFAFFGLPQSAVQISSNGALGFPSVPTMAMSEPLATTGARNALLPFWDDLVTVGGVCTASFGIAPQRQYVVEWMNARFNSTGDASNLTFEVVLTEGTNTIDFGYLTADNTTSMARVTGGYATVGVIGASNTQSDQIAYRTTNAIGAGRRFRWTPTGAARQCQTARYVHTVIATCENPNEVPVWDVMNVAGSVAPGGAVILAVKTAETPADLAAAPSVLLPGLVNLGANTPTQIPLTGQLRAANPALGLDRRPVMQLTAMLHPSTDRTQPSVLGGMEFQYICVPNEHLAPCISGQPCSLGAGGCRRGVTACVNSAGGRPFEICQEAGRANVGSSCGNGLVCNTNGDCVPCAEGESCTIPGQACMRGRVSCSTGAPQCVAVEQLPPGTACGGNVATYQRGTSTFDWIDACATTGRDLWLAGGMDRTQVVALPFAFTAFGTPRRELAISQNGAIGFPTTAPSGVNVALPTTALGDAILPFWDALLTPNGVCTAVVGAEPNRRFVIQYAGAQIAGVAGSALDFEVVLSESTNAIDVIYKRMAGTGDRPTGSGATIGIQRADGSVVDQVGYNAAGAVQTGTTLRWTTNVTAVCAPNGACMPCAPGVACDANGVCALGTQTCSAGIAMCIPTGRRAATPEACNGVDDDCDGVVDEDCRPCVQAVGGSTTRATQTVWQINRGTGPRCWGFQTARHGDPIEYSFTSIPAANDLGWGPHGNDIYFADPSTLCGVCECRYGGDFTHFQTSFVLPTGYRASSLRLQIGTVDDGVRISVFNSRYPNGVVDPGSYAYYPNGGTTDLAAYLAPGQNRVVLTHVDDCCRERIIRGVSIVLDDMPLQSCATITNPTQCLPGWADCDGNAMNGCEENLATSRVACGACGNSCGSGWCDNGVCRASSCTNGVRDGNETDVDCGGSCGACTACSACWQNSDCATGMCVAGQCTFVAERFLDWRSQCTGIGGNDQLTVRNMPAGQYQIEALPSAGANSAVNWPSTGWFWRLDGDCNGLAVPNFAQTPSFSTRDQAFAALRSSSAAATWAGGDLSCRFRDTDCRDNQGGVYFRMRLACAPLANNCPAGFADCDRNPSNGCEVNTNTALGACGACGRACPSVPNAGSTCTNGTCGFTCIAGYADCNGLPADGCETAVGSALSNCGACGRVCASGPRGVATCSAGVCRTICETGYADCDGDPANGCEVNVRSSVSHCGACGRACVTPNGTPVCTNGTCGIAICTGSFRNCDGNTANGCERDTGSDVNNCGVCGNVCPARANAATTCSAGGCGYTCNPGWADCDGVATNGCEVNTLTSTTNCGACGRACTTANGTPVCTSGTCGIASCSGRFRNCDGLVPNGCERDTGSDANNCGACGVVCSAPNATPRCTSGACGLSVCNTGFGNCNGVASDGCEVNTLNDANNCGGCGTRCGVNQACANGYCVGNGVLRFTLTWDNNSDMDIHVTPPGCTQTIAYNNLSACGGTLDRDDIYYTGPENIFWLTSAPRGRYNICISPYRITQPINWTLRIYSNTTLLRTETGRSTPSMGFGCSHNLTLDF